MDPPVNARHPFTLRWDLKGEKGAGRRMLLHFLVGDSVWFEGGQDDTERMDEFIRAHLGLQETWRYLIHRLQDERNPELIHVWVDDRVGAESYEQVKPLPQEVSEARRRRTVWIDGPPLPESVSLPGHLHPGKQHPVPYPWNTCYVEYFQEYHPDFADKLVYTVKYFEHIEEIELYDPTDLAIARMTFLKR